MKEPRIYPDQTRKQRALEYERCNMWREAATEWKHAGEEYKTDYDACIMLANAVERGDAFRRRVLQVAGEEPEVCDKQDSIAWNEWFKLMSTVKY